MSAYWSKFQILQILIKFQHLTSTFGFKSTIFRSTRWVQNFNRWWIPNGFFIYPFVLERPKSCKWCSLAYSMLTVMVNWKYLWPRLQLHCIVHVSTSPGYFPSWSTKESKQILLLLLTQAAEVAVFGWLMGWLPLLTILLKLSLLPYFWLKISRRNKPQKRSVLKSDLTVSTFTCS